MVRPTKSLRWTALALLWVPAALASDVPTPHVEGPVLSLSDRVSALERGLGSSLGWDERYVIDRYETALLDHWLGLHHQAAESFFLLVTSGVLQPLNLQSDGEWYLAESLFEAGQWAMAAKQFDRVRKEKAEPFHPEAVARLYEIYGRTDDWTAFDALVASDPPSPAFGAQMYHFAKGEHRRGRRTAALDAFEAVSETDPTYARAAYYAGVLRVEAGEWALATQKFEASLSRPADNAIDAAVHDQARMALARLALGEGDASLAAQHYNRVEPLSPLHGDRLYESIWTHVARDDWRSAQQLIDLFVFAFPDHAYVVDAKHLAAQLNVQASDWNAATGTYEELVERNAVNAAAVERIRLGRVPLRELASDYDVASDVQTQIDRDSELQWLKEIDHDVAFQGEQLRDAHGLIAELSRTLSGAEPGHVDRLQTSALTLHLDLLQEQLDVCAAEEEWLLRLGGTGAEEKLAPLRAERAAAADRIAKERAEIANAAAELDAHGEQVERLGQDFEVVRASARGYTIAMRQLRRQLVQTDDADEATTERVRNELRRIEGDHLDAIHRLEELAGQISTLAPPRSIADLRRNAESAAMVDGIVASHRRVRESLARDPNQELEIESSHERLVGDLRNVNSLLDRIASLRDNQLAEFERRFAREVGLVARWTDEHHGMARSMRSSGGSLLDEGYDRVAAHFEDSVLKAQMGMVDVYWAQKVQIADHLAQVKKDRETVLADIKGRLSVIHQKMGDQP